MYMCRSPAGVVVLNTYAHQALIWRSICIGLLLAALLLQPQRSHQEDEGVVVLNLLHGRLSGQWALDHCILVQLLQTHSTTAAGQRYRTQAAVQRRGRYKAVLR